MLGSLAELVAIGRDGLYRNWGSRGEADAFDWVEGQLEQLGFLARQGASVERRGFRIPYAVELRRAELSLTVAGRDVAVPAHALHGNRDDRTLALRFDSDGSPDDDEADPVLVTAGVRVIRTATALASLRPGSLRGTVAVADYALLDRGVLPANVAGQAAWTLLTAEPAALVLVTQFSNARGVSHGSFLGDVSILVSLASPAPVPTLFARLEDLSGSGILEGADLERITRASVAWDADFRSPAASEYLAFRIPGRDPSRAVLLGAHVDSANTPGAMDDGSGVVTLLEVARTLDGDRVTPPTDVHLLFFGSHERGLYGSSAFVAENSELLDRAVAMLQTDCLAHPLDGFTGELVLEAPSYRAFGDSRLPFPVALQQAAARVGVRLGVLEVAGLVSDNSSFAGLGVPAADQIFLDASMQEVHVEGHLHDPYDDLPLAALHAEELRSMAKVALAAALDLPGAAASFRVEPAPVSRAVFVASRTEAVQMTPAHLSTLGMALGWEGWDVDVVPYGTPVGAAELAGAGLVVVLPVLDYAVPSGGAEPYDEAFSAAEVEALARYAEDGGLLVLTHSASRLRYGTAPFEENEDWDEMNALGARLGATFEDRRIDATEATTEGSHPLVSGIPSLALAAGNGRAVRAPAGRTLARAGSDVAAALVPVGPSGGEVLALSDLAILGGWTARPPNFVFWQNLARYARSRGR